MLNTQPGTYALILQSDVVSNVDLGCLGKTQVLPGYYVYIGSAFGPGGIAARVNRHCRKIKRKHWHIDYLREITTPAAVYCCYEISHLEHDWTQAIMKSDGFKAMTSFGCTDCQCARHLFYSTIEPIRKLPSSLKNEKIEIEYLGE